MLNKAEQDMIFRLLENGTPLSAIARQLGRSIGTIYKYQRLYAEKSQPRNQDNKISRKILPFQEDINQFLRNKKKNIFKLFLELQDKGYQGSYSLLNSHAQLLQTSQNDTYKRSIRVETGPGEQAQVDWGSFGEVKLNGHTERLYAFVYVLSYSRAMYVEFVVRQNQPTFQSCHIHAFEALGIPKTIRYDNVKTVVLMREKLPEGVTKLHFNPAFKDFALYYGFVPELCPPYWPRAKGKVEAGVKYLRHNFAEGRWFKKTFVNLEELNQKVKLWLEKSANQRIHKTTNEKPNERWLKEKQFLKFPNGLTAYNTTPLLHRRSTKDALIQYKSNLYSVPTEYSQKKLYVREIAKHGLPIVEIYYRNEPIATHNISYEKGKWIVADEHIIKRDRKNLSISKKSKGNNDSDIKVTMPELSYYDFVTP